MKDKKNKVILRQVILFTLLFVGVNVFLDWHFYGIYKERLDVLGAVIQSEQADKLDLVIEILKAEKVDSERGIAVLSEYGYLKNSENKYLIEFKRECIITFIVSFLFSCSLIAWWYCERIRSRKRTEHILEELESCLVQFRENGVVTRLEENGELAERVNHQLESLSQYLKIVTEKAIQEKEETKSLVTDLSHQLKTPVAALDTCFTILSDSSLTEEEREEFTERCRNELDGLEVLLQSLIQISRMESGIITIECTKVPLIDTITMAVNRIYPKASKKQIEICVDCPDRLRSIEIKQDKKWLCEAFINILDNAVKYSEANTEILISIKERSSFVRIEIKDQGCGIPKEEYHKVFQRFYRGKGEKIRTENGSGVGLYLAREIIGSHHGTVTVTSYEEKKYAKNHGSTFVIQIPSFR